MIKDFSPRLYQQTIFATATEKNTLVVLPTGLGKTYVFLMLASHRLSKFPDKKILFLGPTRPLINQYFELFKKHLEIDEKEMALFTGFVSPEKREKLWKNSKIIFSTPQGLENDVISNRINLEEVSLLGFDEAHRATGDYSYVWIAQQYIKKATNPRIIGMTASPGSDIEKITEVCNNLFIESVEIRTDDDPDVKQYIQDVKVKWIYVELPKHFKEIQKFLSDCLKSKIVSLKEYLPSLVHTETKRDLLVLQSQILSSISNGDRNFENMKALSVLAEAMKVMHASELLESQGLSPLLEFMEGMIEKSITTKTKAVINLVSDLNFKSALAVARNLKELRMEHPKIIELRSIVGSFAKDQKKKIIIFSQYRDSITNLVDILNKVSGVKAKMFVGQQKKKGTGLSQKEQIAMINEFKEEKFNVMVMSSVGEEGLDIPAVDVVVFFEPVPSAIRTIQRRGRTGRQTEGEVIVLVTKGTRDEAYRWVAFHKENKMHDILKSLKTKFIAQKEKTEKPISEFLLGETEIVIHADYREKGSGIIKKLVDLGIKINLTSLEVGDYLLSQDLCVEFKTVEDFVDSIIDRRLFTQIKEMKKYRKQLIILEGTEDIYAQRKLHPNAIRGMLAAICLDYDVPILTTKNPEDSALLMAMIAKREQVQKDKEFTMHSVKPLTLKEQQEYLISSLPGIGPALSKPLLKKFGSVKKIINSSVSELKEVDLIGDKKAAKIREVLDSDYNEVPLN
jgi:Fanconi anemia group M protein